MAPLGLSTYLSFKIKKILPKGKKFFFFFLIGSILPDIDIILSIFISTIFYKTINIYLLHNTFTHSIISLGLMHLFFLIVYEIKKNKSLITISKALIAGMMFHISIDIFLGFEIIDIFWPLPIGIINFFSIEKSSSIKNILLGFEFFFFRLCASILIEKILNTPNQMHNFIKPLSLWMKYEGYLFFIFLICLIIIPQYIILIFSIFYIPSYIMLVFSIYKLRNLLIGKII